MNSPNSFWSCAVLIALHLTFFFSAFSQSELDFNAEKVTTEIHNYLIGESSESLDIMVVLKEQAELQGYLSGFARGEISMEERKQAVLKTLHEVAEAHQPAVLEYLLSIEGIDPASINRHWIVNGFSLRADRSAIRELSLHPDIALIEKVEVPILDEPTESSETARSQNGREPGHDMINAPALWEMGYTGYGTKVLVFDSGNDQFHPAVNSSFLWHNYPLEQVWSGFGDYVMDCMSHGTHVGGTITGLDRRTNDTIGVAFNARWMSAPINFGRCNRPFFQPIRSTVQAFEWAMNPDGNPNTIDDMPDVINCSWTSGGSQSCENASSRALMDAVQAAGIAVVWSAGNNGPDFGTVRGFGSINNSLVNTFSVGAVNFQGDIADFSSRGPAQCLVGDFSLDIKPEVSAPGVGVRSAITGGGYSQFNGTSMASPHVSGALLLLKEAFPYLDGESLLMALYLTAVDRGEPGEDNVYGMGIIDALAAFNYLKGQGFDPVPPVSIRHDLVLFDATIAARGICNSGINPKLAIQNAGTDTVRTFWVRWYFEEFPDLSDSILWEGVLLPGEMVEYSFRFSQEIPVGKHEVLFEIDSPNGESDLRNLNNVFKYQFSVVDGETSEGEVNPDFVNLECRGSRVLLQMSDASESDNVRWFSAPEGGSSIATGEQFLTDPLFENTTFYADIFNTYRVGKREPVEEADLSAFDDSGLRFDAKIPVQIKTVTVYVNSPGQRSIRIQDKRGNTIFNRSFFLTSAGEHQLELNASIPAGIDHRIIQSGGAKFKGDIVGAEFPYEVEDFFTIKESVGLFNPELNQNAYLYFYNWEIEAGQVCGRIPVYVEIGDRETIPIQIFTDTLFYMLEDGIAAVDFFAEWESNTGFEWEFGNGIEAVGDTVGTVYTEAGQYEVRVRSVSDDGCINVGTLQITIEEGPVFVRELHSLTTELHLFPNPASSELFLSLAEVELLEIQYQIINPLGAEILKGRLERNQDQHFSLDIAALKAGYYILIIQGKQGDQWVGRFVKN
ncbi:MAG: T9SS C-terminal target domain-containing protein [Saprospirales bacterium]|nr:MAG: T9SS C-terminal target domain-containing protein [Saprospirales bacterium]